MKQTRPISVTVIAILHFVFGGLWLLCGIANLAMLLAGMQQFVTSFANFGPSNNPQVAKQQELQKDIMKFTTEVQSPAFQYVQQLQNVTLSILMIVSGIGLIKMKPWGRVLSLVYGIVSIVSHVAILVYMLMVTIPAAQHFAEQMGAKSQEAKMMASLMRVGVYVGLVTPFISMIYPAIVLILMLRPSVAAAFRGETVCAAGSHPDETFEAEDKWGRG